VHDPVHNAVHRYQPVLKKHKMLDQVFRFQDLEALVSKLEAQDAAEHHTHHKAADAHD